MGKTERIVITLSISLAVFATTFWALTSSPYAIGIDGYYYAAQIRSYLEKGRFFASDASWVLYAMAYFSRLGADIVVMNKVFVATASVAFFWSAHSLLQIFTGRLPSLLIAASLLAGSYLQFCRTNFIKNFIGLVFFTIFLKQVLQRLKAIPPMPGDRRTQLLTAVAFFGCLVSHTQTAFLALTTGVLYFAFTLRSKNLPDRGVRKIWLWVAAILGGVLLLLLYRNRARFSALAWSDLFDSSLFPLQLEKLNAGSQRLAIEAFGLMAINVVFLVRYLRRIVYEKVADPVETIIAVLLIVTANPFYTAAEAQWGFRLHLVSIVPSALALVLLFPHGLTQLTGRLAGLASYAAVLGLIALSYRQLQYNMRLSQIDYAEVTAAVAKLSLPDRHLLIAHQGFDYFYCFSRKGDAFHFLAEDKHRGREVLRILHGFPSGTLKDVQFTMPPLKLTRNYTLISEADFPKILGKLSPLEKKLLLTYRNPTAERDLFLRQRDRTVER